MRALLGASLIDNKRKSDENLQQGFLMIPLLKNQAYEILFIDHWGLHVFLCCAWILLKMGQHRICEDDLFLASPFPKP
ncbi:hypothetical protein AXX17_AT1G09080 [Arabidopsis thaliana]|uniref:Uncharacterized protein n=1 Tax=Arabidopsis thaliana TaxID=3702 RepID=A0A178W728_ARATH|nr:hypothetical protein AXX17_AT1G09080 [Arabidopsis thaliana]